MRRLFLDLDGVFADFDGAFEPLFGFDHRGVSDEAMWFAINDHGSYFRDLPVCEGSLDFYRDVEYLHPTILTAAPQHDFLNVAKQKQGWIEEHLGDVPVIYTPGSKAKTLYCRPGDILVDDFQANTDRWTKAGGIGIQHLGNFGVTRGHLAFALS